MAEIGGCLAGQLDTWVEEDGIGPEIAEGEAEGSLHYSNWQGVPRCEGTPKQDRTNIRAPGSGLAKQCS